MTHSRMVVATITLGAMLLACGEAPAATDPREEQSGIEAPDVLQDEVPEVRIGMEDLDVPTGPGITAEDFYGECNALRNEEGNIERGVDSLPGFFRLTDSHFWIDVAGVVQLDRPRVAERDLWVELDGVLSGRTNGEVAPIEITLHPLEIGALAWAEVNGFDSLVGVVDTGNMSFGLITIVLTPDGFMVPGPCSKFLVEPSLRDAIEGDVESFLRLVPTMDRDELVAVFYGEPTESDTIAPVIGS